ncbi:nucleotide exchange factor GrpE [Nocardioides pacificus]
MTPSPEGQSPEGQSSQDDRTPEGEPRDAAAPSPEGVAPDPADLSPEAAEELLEEELEDDLGRARRDVVELTSDLQRLQAEFLNYKRRVDRDRDLIRENATYTALAPITEVLDTIDRAREHGEVEGGFKAVADQLERVVTGVGLIKYGAPGDPFDPTIHEALSHLGEDAGVEVTTCKVVAKAGYRIGDRVVRAAQVLVVDPAAPTAPAADSSAGE